MAQESSARKRKTIAVRVIFRYGFVVVAVCMVLTSAIYASQQFEKFLIRDPRFFLPGPADYGMESLNLQLNGINYASRQRILRLFEQDYGRSLYLLPLAQRRKSLLNIAWVHDATVVRVWPNRIVVDIRERRPAAFVKVPSDGMTRWALIDDEGVILEPPPKAPFRLPVLAGVLVAEEPDKRALRVRRMRRLMQDLGNLSDKVSEVDASDLDNLKITEQVQGKVVSLILGDTNFASRVRNFLDHYQDIRKKVPKATTFDLRLDDRITGLEDGVHAR